jgi:excisionase family DNA binding protein
MEKVQPVMVRPMDAATMLSVSRSKLYEMIHQGIVPAAKIGGVLRIPRAAIDRIAHEALNAGTAQEGAR